jgi:hypothetical protein
MQHLLHASHRLLRGEMTEVADKPLGMQVSKQIKFEWDMDMYFRSC